MIRKIIQIDSEKCNGCGACAAACHEGAIGMVDGKAKLLRDDYCDGLGDCLPTCPTDAITFVEREAAAYDEEAVKANLIAKKLEKELVSLSASCQRDCSGEDSFAESRTPQNLDIRADVMPDTLCSKLSNWPVQIKLAPLSAPYFDGANLLIAADCTAYAYADFHKQFMAGRITLIGCPKLDDIDYTEKLSEILRRNNIASVSVLRMEVPCCGGLETAVTQAISASGKFLPYQVVTISTEGAIL